MRRIGLAVILAIGLTFAPLVAPASANELITLFPGQALHRWSCCGSQVRRILR